ncbi:MAG: MFS transporter [Patulibacter minatonensis]
MSTTDAPTSSTAAGHPGASTTPPAPPASRAKQGDPWLTLIAVSLGVMMVALDGTVVGVANPTIQRDLNASLAGLQWITNGYLLALAVLLILGGKLGDRYGRRKMYIAGIVGFALFSLGCALSTSTGMLIAFRVLQGFAGALLMPNTLAILRAAFPEDKLNQAVGIWGATSALAVASGPIIGGLLVEHVSWESIFLINLPLGIVAALFSFRYVKESRESAQAGGFDYPGVVLLAGGLFSLIWGIIKSQERGWDSAYVLGFIIGGLVVLGLFAAWEARSKDPLLPLDVFRSRAVSAGTVLVIVGFLALFGILFFIGLYLQNTHGYSPVQTGVRMLPLTATFVVSAPLGGLLTERFGARPTVILGMLLLIAAFLGLSGLQVDTAYSGQWPYFLMIGFAFGLIIVSTTEAIVGNISVERGGVGGGLQSTANQLGGVIGTALFGSIIVSSVSGSLGDELAAAGVQGDAAQAVLANKEIVGQGIAPVSRDMPAQLADAITAASHASFMEGLQTAMYVGAGLAAVSVFLALFITEGRKLDAHEKAAH